MVSQPWRTAVVLAVVTSALTVPVASAQATERSGTTTSIQIEVLSGRADLVTGDDAQPDALDEGCWTRGEDPSFVEETLDRDPDSVCEQLYPSASFPREVAGEHIAADVIKCQRKPLSRADYDVAWTDEQWARLNAIFPTGVCDYSRPGVEQQGLIGTWLRY